MKRTKAEKQEYFRQLRKHWQEAKKLLTEQKISEIQAIIATHGMKISQTGFMFVSIQMERAGFDGLPYLDAKTFKGWKDNGFQVKKGEHSVLSGVTWIAVGGSDDDSDDSGYMLPKEYHLFHRSQVEAA